MTATVIDNPLTMGGIMTLVFSKDFHPTPVNHRNTRSYVRKTDPSDDNISNLSLQPPTISVSREKEYIDAQIVISPLPLISVSELNHCAIERILNHVKDAFIRGEYDDAELDGWLDGRSFSFCMTYVFLYDRHGALNINFYVSHTENAPAWKTDDIPEQFGTTKHGKDGKNSKKTVPDSVYTAMSSGEITLMKDAFIRQCVRALKNYVGLVHDYSQRHGIEPDYYRTGLPGSL